MTRHESRRIGKQEGSAIQRARRTCASVIRSIRYNVTYNQASTAVWETINALDDYAQACMGRDDALRGITLAVCAGQVRRMERHKRQRRERS